MPAHATEPPTTANNAGGNRPNAAGTANGCGRLCPNRPHQRPKASPPHHRWTPVPRLWPIRQQPPSTPSAWASAQPKFPRILWSGLATGQAATSFSPWRRVPPSSNSVRAHAVRRYDASGSGKRDSASGDTAAVERAGLVSGRHPEQARYVVMYW